MAARVQEILIADHDPQLRRLLKRTLETEHYRVSMATTRQEILEIIRYAQLDLIVLDETIDGLDACRQIRTFSSIPIIMVSSHEQEDEKVQAFDLGADDYVLKPFSLLELLARMRAILRRVCSSWCPAHQQIVLQRGDLTLDELHHLVLRDGKDLQLTSTEYRLLAYFMRHAGQILTHTLLLEQIWGIDYAGEGHMLQVTINRLRQKLDQDHQRYIQTRPGIGYQFRSQATVNTRERTKKN